MTKTLILVEIDHTPGTNNDLEKSVRTLADGFLYRPHVLGVRVVQLKAAHDVPGDTVTVQLSPPLASSFNRTPT